MTDDTGRAPVKTDQSERPDERVRRDWRPVRCRGRRGCKAVRAIGKLCVACGATGDFRPW